MTRFIFHRRAAWWCRGALAGVAGLLAVGCGDINFNTPTTPTWTFPGSGAGIRTLQITGSLTAEQGTCIEARVLYDGRELPDSRTVCPDEAGCVRLDLSGETTTGAGRHTLSFQVLRQPDGATAYVADVSIRLTREGLSFVYRMSPDPVRKTLRAGDTVSFQLSFQD